MKTLRTGAIAAVAVAALAAVGCGSSDSSKDNLNVLFRQTLQAKNASDPKFSAFYMPGKYWYAAMSWVYGNGGAIAKQDGGKERSDHSFKMREAYKEFQLFVQ